MSRSQIISTDLPLWTDGRTHIVIHRLTAEMVGIMHPGVHVHVHVCLDCEVRSIPCTLDFEPVPYSSGLAV